MKGSGERWWEGEAGEGSGEKEVDGIWRERFIGMLLVEEDSYNRNDRIFWDGWKSINYILKKNYMKTMDLARRTCGELDVRCSS